MSPVRLVPYSEFRKCEYCENEFELPYSVKGAGRFCSRACLYAWMGKDAYKTTICAYCQTPFTHRTNQRDRKFCSSSCAMRNHLKTGEDNHSWKPHFTVQCEYCGKLQEVPECKLKRFRFCSAPCKRAWVLHNMPRVSSIEHKMQKAFDRVGLQPEAQYTVGAFSIDFAFVEHKLAIECDGDYWHGTEHQKKKDRIKDGYLKHEGWHVVRLTETEINISAIACVRRIQDLLTR